MHNRLLTYTASCTVFQLSYSIGKSITFDKGVPLANAVVLDNLCKRRHKSYIAVNQILWTTFSHDSIGLSLTTLTQLAFKYAEFCRAMQNNGHYAVQGHSRSPILVPFKSRYLAPFQVIAVIGQIFACGRRYLSLTHSFRVNPY